MRILVEAMCAEYGGIRTYAEHLLRVWPQEYPGDEVHVIVREGMDLGMGLDPSIRLHVVPVPRLGPIGRPVAQTAALRRLIAELRPDAVLATLPSTTVRKLDAPTAVVVYDLRHRLRPRQFSRGARLLRAVSYRRGYEIADGFISISQRSLDDLHQLHPRTRPKPSTVAHLGADHVDDWPQASSRPAGTPPRALAFAHQSNKNADLLLDAWSLLAQRGGVPPRLLLLGLSAERRAAMTEGLAARGIEQLVDLEPFVSDEEFREYFASSDLIVFPSDFEGFGLPVVEGMRVGIPVVIGPERATQEVAAGHAVVMADWTPDTLADSVQEALETSDQRLEAARRFADRYTWASTVRRTRAMLAQLARDPFDQAECPDVPRKTP